MSLRCRRRRAGGDLEHVPGWGIIDQDLALAELLEGSAELSHLVVSQALARSQVVAIDSRPRGQQAVRDLEMAHFEADEEHGDLEIDRHVFHDVERECSLAHAGPARQDDQLAGLETPGEIVEIGEARGDPRDGMGRISPCHDPIHRLAQHVMDFDHVSADLIFGDAEDLLFGGLEKLFPGIFI